MDNPLVFLTAVLGLGITAQWLAWRFRLPSILILLAFGFMAGHFGGANPDNLVEQELLFAIVSLSVAVILFEGGMSLHFRELQEAGRAVFQLVSVGALVTWALTTAACQLLLHMDWRIASLTGAILVVTGPTVIAPLLRHVRPVRRVGSIVKWEGIVIDPIGAVLAVLIFEAVFVEPANVIPALLRTIAVGAIVGGITAVLLVQMLKRYWIPDFLHNAAFLLAAVVTFTISNLVQHESGLLTVTILGVMLRNQKSVAVQHVVEFKEHLRVLLISCLFIVLAARIELTDVLKIGWGGTGFLATLILVIRPAAAIASTVGTDLTWSERIFLAFLAPRGIVAAAVSTIFALEVSHHFHDVVAPAGHELIVPVTFLVIVGTVAIYGLLAVPLARRLGLAVPNPQGILIAGAAAWIREVAKALEEEDVQVLLVDTNYRNIAAARMAGLPTYCASIVSEYVSEEIDLGGIGRIMALTPNDDLNSLATMEFAHFFGRANVFQLAPWEAGGGRHEVSAHIRARVLFDECLTYSEIASRFDRGCQLKRTKITEEFSYEDFVKHYEGKAIPMFIISAKSVDICIAQSKQVPKAGDTLVALVEPTDEANGVDH